ncbi:MAG: hypothetical protein IIA73_10335 [Proteobacteria bacterium]|nr:hypothetical protein [Pseudomonadota bacterium]
MKILRVGIVSYDEMKNRTLAIARGERAEPDVDRERLRTDELTRSAVAAVEGMVQGFHKGLHGFDLALRSLDVRNTSDKIDAGANRRAHQTEHVIFRTTEAQSNQHTAES